MGKPTSRKARRRVVFLTDVITPYTVAVMGAMSRLAELTVLFCSERGSRSADWTISRDLGFDHRVIEGAKIGRSVDNTDYYLSPRIGLAIAELRPDAVISAGFSIPTLYAATYCLATGAGLVIHSDGTAESEADLNLLQQVSRRTLLRAAGACAANSEPAARRFRELGFPETRVFPAPHSTDLEPLWEVARTRAVAEGRVNVLSVGRLIPRKGTDRLVRAAARAQSMGADLHLTIVGTGPEEASLRKLSAEIGLDTIFKGFVDQPDLPAVYRDADVFAFPTLMDPFGMVVLEAAATGLPVIASSHAGATQDLIKHRTNGLVIDPNDEEGFASGLLEVSSSPELRGRLGVAAYESTRSRTPESAAAGYLAAVESSITAGRLRLRIRR